MTTTVTYSSEQARMMDESMTRVAGDMSGKDLDGLVLNIFQMLSKQLQGQNSYMYANALLTIMNASPSPSGVSRSPISTVPLTPMYTSDAELDSVFTKAFQESETSPSLTPRDRVLLRIFFFGAAAVVSFTNIVKVGSFSSDISFNFDSEGKPATYQSVIDAFPTKTTRDILSIGCDVTLDMYKTIIEMKNNDDYFNLIKRSTVDSFNGRMGTSYKSDGTDDLTLMINTMNVGPTYIMWLATQKWKIDWNWTGA